MVDIEIDAALAQRFTGTLAVDEETMACAAFLDRYRGATSQSYTADLRDWLAGALNTGGLTPLAARRAHVELYLRDPELAVRIICWFPLRRRRRRGAGGLRQETDR